VYQRYDSSNAYVSISDADRHPSLHYLATIHHGIDTNAFSLQAAQRKRKCYRKPNAHEITKGDLCLVIKDGASGGKNNYCPECAEPILDQAQIDLDRLRVELNPVVSGRLIRYAAPASARHWSRMSSRKPNRSTRNERPSATPRATCPSSAAWSSGQPFAAAHARTSAGE